MLLSCNIPNYLLKCQSERNIIVVITYYLKRDNETQIQMTFDIQMNNYSSLEISAPSFKNYPPTTAAS